jgi:hypothetical protein
VAAAVVTAVALPLQPIPKAEHYHKSDRLILIQQHPILMHPQQNM